MDAAQIRVALTEAMGSSRGSAMAVVATLRRATLAFVCTPRRVVRAKSHSVNDRETAAQLKDGPEPLNSTYEYLSSFIFHVTQSMRPI